MERCLFCGLAIHRGMVGTHALFLPVYAAGLACLYYNLPRPPDSFSSIHSLQVVLQYLDSSSSLRLLVLPSPLAPLLPTGCIVHPQHLYGSRNHEAQHRHGGRYPRQRASTCCFYLLACQTACDTTCCSSPLFEHMAERWERRRQRWLSRWRMGSVLEVYHEIPGKSYDRWFH